jgi:hypothetical protein
MRRKVMRFKTLGKIGEEISSIFYKPAFRSSRSTPPILPIAPASSYASRSLRNVAPNQDRTERVGTL